MDSYSCTSLQHILASQFDADQILIPVRFRANSPSAPTTALRQLRLVSQHADAMETSFWHAVSRHHTPDDQADAALAALGVTRPSDALILQHTHGSLASILLHALPHE